MLTSTVSATSAPTESEDGSTVLGSSHRNQSERCELTTFSGLTVAILTVAGTFLNVTDQFLKCAITDTLGPINSFFVMGGCPYTLREVQQHPQPLPSTHQMYRSSKQKDLQTLPSQGGVVPSGKLLLSDVLFYLILTSLRHILFLY